MSDWLTLLYCGLSGMMTMLVALGMGATAILPGIDRWSKRFFISFFAVLLLCVIVGLGDGMVAGKPGLVAWGRAVIFFALSRRGGAVGRISHIAGRRPVHRLLLLYLP